MLSYQSSELYSYDAYYGCVLPIALTRTLNNVYFVTPPVRPWEKDYTTYLYVLGEEH